MRFLLLVTAAALAPSELGPALRRVGLQEEAAALLLDAAPGCELTPDAAARKVASHVRDAAARRDRHDAVCRRVAAACRALHSEVKRDAPLWRLGLDLKGPGRRAVDVSICRDDEWSFVEVTVRAFAGDASLIKAAIEEKRAKYADLPRVHVLALDAVTGRAPDGVFADLEAAGLVADGDELADACAAAVVTRCAAPLLPRKRRRKPAPLPVAPGLARPRTRRERRAARAGGGGV
mmetsp:Transcript_6092/g.15543  ORF Transcript_6092/g.15543 Transcript_6092/m.15543 type:complete len:235 (-) Transcript_6092:12-716(-)